MTLTVLILVLIVSFTILTAFVWGAFQILHSVFPALIPTITFAQSFLVALAFRMISLVFANSRKD